MDFIETAQKALKIIEQHSANTGRVRLSNSLQYIELDLNSCLPLLNELYDTNVRLEDTANVITIKDLLTLWDLEIAHHVPSDVEEKRDNDNDVNDVEEIDQNQNTLNFSQKKKDVSNSEVGKDFKLTWFQKLSFGVFLCYLCLLLLNKCTSYNNELSQESEGMLFSVMKVLNGIDTVIDPGNWLLGLPQLVFGEKLGINIACIIMFGLVTIIYTSTLLSEKDYQIYYHQPFISIIVILLAIYKGIYGDLAFNLVWTAVVPLTYIILTSIGISIVHFEFKLFRPQKRIFKSILQIIPLFVWLLVLLLFN